jgi:ABC-type multidrug transport system ATPase subunit
VKTLLVENMAFSLPPGGIVGVIGPNGAGKTTLFRMITGQEKPDSGRSMSAKRWPWPMWTRVATCWIRTNHLGNDFRRTR